MNVLILGASGFLGSYLCYSFAQGDYDVSGVVRKYIPFVPQPQMAQDLEEVERIIHQLAPEFVINCVAMASHEACEENPTDALRVNAEYPKRWAQAASSRGSRFVHLSTDAVFSGNRDAPYGETDAPEPFSVYGQSKLEGERLVGAVNGDALIVRTNFFGWSPGGDRGILDFFHRAFVDGREVTGFDDYVVSSLYVGNLFDALQGLISVGATGLHHVGSSSPLSKYDFGLAVAEKGNISSASMARGQMRRARGLAHRGSNLSLSPHKTEQILGWNMPSTESGIARAYEEKSLLQQFFTTEKKD
jgi:dTDP-4-dehydrorhamnose reductase